MEIQDIIKQMTKSKEEIYSCICTVVEIDEEKRYIKVKPSNGGAEIFDVRLQTVVSGALGLVYFPKLDSEVIISYVSKNLAYVALFSEIEKVKLDIGDFSLFFDATHANLAVENIDVIATNTEISSDEVTVNSNNVTINNDSAVMVATNTFEIQGTQITLTAPTINITGAVAVAGTLSVSGAVVLGGGSNGGVPKSLSMMQEINKIKTDFQNLKAKFSAWMPVNFDGGAALKTQLSTWSPNTTPVTQAGISNPNVTQ